MLPHNDVLRQLIAEAPEPPRINWPQRYGPLLVGVVLTLTTLACSFMDRSDRAAQITRLPTFTRTPLPTLTPTAISPPEAIATVPLSSGAMVPLLTPVPSPLPTNPVVAPAAVPANPIPSPTLSQSPVPDENLAEPLFDNSNAFPLPPTPTPTTDFNANPAAAPTKTPIVIPTVTPIPETAGWSFAGVHTYNDVYEGGLLLYGDMINDTGLPQKVAYITGVFYDGQGQIVANQESTSEYWPVGVIPPDGRVPFELTVNGIQTSSTYKLWVSSETSNKPPRQDFNFDGVEQWSEDESYCVAGQVQNSGSELREYLVIAAVLYDDQGNVVNFSEAVESDSERLSSDDPLDFEICIDPPNQNAARYELRAWGQ